MSSSATECDFYNFCLCITSDKWKNGYTESEVAEALRIIQKINNIQQITVRFCCDQLFIKGCFPVSYPVDKQIENLKECFPKGQRIFIEMNAEKTAINQLQGLNTTGKNPHSWYRLHVTLPDLQDDLTYRVKLRILSQEGRYLAVDKDGKKLTSLLDENIQPIEKNPVTFSITTRPASTAAEAILMDIHGNYVHVDRDYKIQLLPGMPQDWFQYAKVDGNTNFKLKKKWLGVKYNVGKMVKKFEYTEIDL